MPMNPEYKAPWLAALRSGKYKQTQRVLYDGSGYCCLGVLCKVAGSNFVITNTDEVEDNKEDPRYEPTDLKGETVSDAENLSPDGRELFGLYDDVSETLILMNDGDISKARKPKTFAEIADWIEENL